MKKFLGPLLTAGTLLTLLYTVYGYREQNEKLKSERDGLTKPMGGGNNQNIVDSLQEELFLLQTQNGRYELSLQHLEEINPKAAKQFNDYLTNETE